MGVDSSNKRIAMLKSMAPAKQKVQPPTVTANSVKRSLFGQVDHSEVMAFFQEQLAKMCAENTRRWNFDFVNEQPISGGSFSWEKVTSGDVLSDKTSNDNNVTRAKICKPSTITSHWAKCKTIDRRNTFTKTLTSSRKLVPKRVERIK